jgi:membrane protein implicated in regulation of membrane protease activity
MPRFLTVLGLLALVVVIMGFISVVSTSWDWSAVTGCSILLWLGLAAFVPRRVRRSKGTSQP